MLLLQGASRRTCLPGWPESCPAYFKEDDKIFYEASGLLQRGEAANAAAEKDHLTRAALKLMLKVRCQLRPALMKHLASSPVEQ